MYWLKSGRAESEGRLEQWQEYLGLQERYALKESFKKVVAQVRREGGWRRTAIGVRSMSSKRGGGSQLGLGFGGKGVVAYCMQ